MVDEVDMFDVACNYVIEKLNIEAVKQESTNNRHELHKAWQIYL